MDNKEFNSIVPQDLEKREEFFSSLNRIINLEIEKSATTDAISSEYDKIASNYVDFHNDDLKKSDVKKCAKLIIEEHMSDKITNTEKFLSAATADYELCKNKLS